MVCEENFNIEGNSRTGKVKVDISNKERGECLLDNVERDED